MRTRLALFSSTALLALATGCTAVGSEPSIDENGDGNESAVKACAKGDVVKGIDVSYFQPGVDWGSVKDDGVEFAFARVSYGSKKLDTEFETNWEGMKAAGLLRGAYQYFRPSQDAAAQAQIVVDHLGTLGEGDLPAVIDVETQEGVSDATLVKKIQTWVDIVEEGTGKRPIIYTGPAFWTSLSGSADLTDHPLWVANYKTSCPSLPSGFSGWHFWQSSETGKVDGVDGNVDIDWWNGSLAELIEFAGGGAVDPDPNPDPDPDPDPGLAGPGITAKGPWVSFYGAADGVDLDRTADTFRVINIDADPDAGNFTPSQIATLKAGGKNQVISYMNVGSCETYRSYYDKCEATGALTTPYDGYPDEMWADLSVKAYRDLIVNEVAPALIAQGVDGFFLDNMEVVEHGTNTSNGPCDGACSQGGLDLLWELRQKFPDKLIIMQNATSDVTRLGKTHGVSVPSLLDGISHEEVYSNGGDDVARHQMLAWKSMGLTVSGNDFWIACEEYVGTCGSSGKSEAEDLTSQADADGISIYVTDESAAQQGPCFWEDY